MAHQHDEHRERHDELDGHRRPCEAKSSGDDTNSGRDCEISDSNNHNDAKERTVKTKWQHSLNTYHIAACSEGKHHGQRCQQGTGYS